MEFVAILAADEDDTLFVAVARESTGLLVITFTAGVRHEEKTILPASVPFNLLVAEGVPTERFALTIRVVFFNGLSGWWSGRKGSMT